MRGQPRGWSRSVSRGTCRPGIEPRNQLDWGADAVSLCGRQHAVQQERELGRDPTGSETPGMHGNTSHENREIPGFSRRTRSRAGAGAQREVKRRTPLMHEPGKSDSRVVPKEDQNKARRRVAEGLEGRRLAKRSSPQAATLRTQGRARVDAALGRVRQAASVFVGAVCRHDARQEPGTVVPSAGIRGGGGQQWPFLLRLRSELASAATTGGGGLQAGLQAPPTQSCIPPNRNLLAPPTQRLSSATRNLLAPPT